MKNLIIIATLLLTAGAVHSQTCSELFFSEYSEGTSNNKYFEIYNPTSSAVSLSGYTIYLSGNGGSYTNSFTSNAVIASGDVYVVSTNQSSSTILAESDTAMGYPSVAHYNGDDALILVEGTDTIDVVGVPGVDPGSSWAVGTGSTANHTLVRKATITGGSTNWTTGANEWDVYAQNTWTYVGSHSSTCGGAGVYSVTFQVDLGSLSPSSNGIHIAGSFQSWSPSTTLLSQVGSTSVYSVTVSVPAGPLEYKFINGNAWGDDESVPSAVQVGTYGNSNRWAVISSDTTLPAVMFAGAAPAGMKAIQLNVDMSQETLSSDSVHVAGSFNIWGPAKTQLSYFYGTHRYIVYANISDTVGFMFLNGKDWSSVETVPFNCRQPNTIHRFWPDTVSGVYEVCYNQCGPCVGPFDLTLNIDLNDILSTNTISDVTLAGFFNNWNGTDTLVDIDGDGVYSIMLADFGSGSFEYKIRWHDSSGSTNWEPGANKIVSVSSDTILPVRCFGNDSYGACVTSSTANHSMSLQACTGDVINYEFDITSAFDSTNTFRVEISDFTTSYSSSSPVFSGNFIQVNALSAYQVDTNYQIALHIPDSLLQGVYSVRLVSSSPSTVDGTIGNIIIGESPTPVLASVYKNVAQSLISNDTLSICPSDSAIILAQSIQDGMISWTPNWQWYKNGLPITGQANDTLIVQGTTSNDYFWVRETNNLCDAISDTFYLREDTYSGSLSVSSQYYNPPNALTAIADGGNGYYWHSNKPIYIDDVQNDTVQIGLMSDSTTLYVDVNFGNSCLHQNSILLFDTTVMVCDVFDTIPVFDTIAFYDTTHINVYDTLFVTTIDTVTLTVTDTLIIDVSLVGLNPLSFEYQVKVYPNPTRDYILIDVPSDMISQSYFAELTNPIGQVVYFNQMNQSQLQININTLGATGSYVLKLYDSSLNIVDTRIVLLQ